MSVAAVVTTADELLEAVGSAATEIEVAGSLSGMPMITLQPGGAASGRHSEVRRQGRSADAG